MPESAWSPLRNPVFRWVWLAAIASNIGAWMHDVGAGWLMTSLSPDPFTVALVQAANSAPMFLGLSLSVLKGHYFGIIWT
jgi:Transmembrane secretion effector